MKDDTIQQILKTRTQFLEQDLEMIEAKKKRLAEAEAKVILSLIAQREQLLAIQEQDE